MPLIAFILGLQSKLSPSPIASAMISSASIALTIEALDDLWGLPACRDFRHCLEGNIIALCLLLSSLEGLGGVWRMQGMDVARS